MKVAVFGASGQTGSLVVTEALKRGHEVVAMTRTTLQRRAEAGLENRVGDVTSAKFVAEAIHDCDKIISCIGQTRKTPISKSSSPPTIMSSVARAIVTATGPDAAKQFVYMSAFGVGDDLKKQSIIFRMVLKLFSIGDAYKDHAEAERIIKASGVSWTIVRPVGLTGKDKGTTAVDLGSKWSSFDTVSREAVARFLVHCMEDPSLIDRTMTVGEPSKTQ
jgi:uncharacterized protein YbjT (DUF2867 family)